MSLRDHLIRRIATSGPITLADYMGDCLMHPDWGYYTTRDPFGAGGDFTTAPEISQMFGEMVGTCLAQAWVDQGSPARIVLAELGPGRGTLMADILRTLQAVPQMLAAAEVHLVEASPVLRARQAETLNGFAPQWHASIDTLPEWPLYLVANEFFDALPIRQFIRQGDGWAECQIGVSDGAPNDKGLCFGLAPPTPLAQLAHRLQDTKNGDVVEMCPALQGIAAAIGASVATRGGVALAIDYGGWQSLGDTFQALQDHAPVDPLADPGQADLTAHVDFEALAQGLASGGAAVTAMTAQGMFLERLGMAARAQALAVNTTGAALQSHIAAYRRLTHPQEMGNLFRVIACHPVGTPVPPGLDHA